MVRNTMKYQRIDLQAVPHGSGTRTPVTWPPLLVAALLIRAGGAGGDPLALARPRRGAGRGRVWRARGGRWMPVTCCAACHCAVPVWIG